jgi:hypothetical protein
MKSNFLAFIFSAVLCLSLQASIAFAEDFDSAEQLHKKQTQEKEFKRKLSDNPKVDEELKEYFRNKKELKEKLSPEAQAELKKRYKKKKYKKNGNNKEVSKK